MNEALLRKIIQEEFVAAGLVQLFDVKKIGGTAQTGRDITPDLAWLTNLKKGTNDTDSVATDNTISTLKANAHGYLFNGTSFDRARGNTEFTILASAVRAATTSSANQTNHNARGIMLWFNITAVPGVDTVQLNMDLKDPISGNYISAYTFEPASAVIGFRCYAVYPGMAVGALNGSINQPLPRTWRATVLHVGAGNFTYSVGGCYIL